MRHLMALWVLLALLTAATTFSLIRVQNVQHHQNDALHSIICSAERFIRNSKHETEQQKQQALKFYDDALSSAHLAPCSN